MLEMHVTYNEIGDSKTNYYGSLLRVSFTGRLASGKKELSMAFEDKEAVEVFKVFGEGIEEILEKRSFK